MIFTEQDLRIGTNAFDIINESAWIDGGNIISPKTIALVESSSVGGYVVRFNDVEALSEEYGIDYIDSMLAIAEVNGIDPQYLAVAVNESDIIINPDLIYELANVITVPISRNSTAYQFCEACIDGYMNTGDDGYLSLLVEEEASNKKLIKDMSFEEFDKYMSDPNMVFDLDNPDRSFITKEELEKQKQAEESHKKETNDTINNKKEKGIIDKIKHTVGSAVYKSADWIARKISALRYMYQEWKEKAYDARIQGKASWFQHIGSRILGVIDWALSKLEGFLKASNETRKKYEMKAWSGYNIAKDHMGYDTYEKKYSKGILLANAMKNTLSKKNHK